MITVNYYLHTFLSKEGKSSLYIRVHADGLYSFRLATHEKLKPKDWNHAKQVVKKSDEYFEVINERLDRISNQVQKELREKLDKGEVITATDIKAILRPQRAPTALPAETIRDVYNEWQKNYLEEKNLGNAHRKQKGINYTRRFLQVLTHLETFKPGVTLADIDPAFLKRYRHHLLKAGLQDTTVQNHYKSVKVLLAYRNLPTGFVKPPQAAKPTKHSLYWSEVLQLYTADYNTRRTKEIALCFVANCQLCLRYSDLYKINTNLITVNSFRHGKVTAFNLTQEKTGDTVYIPVPELAKKIIDKYGGKLPLPKLDENSSSASFNRWLKQAAKEAGLNRLVRVTKVINNHVQESWVPLHEQISSHASRHTGYSRIREITGNRDLAEALLGHANAGAYDHTDPALIIDSLLDAWQKISEEAKAA